MNSVLDSWATPHIKNKNNSASNPYPFENKSNDLTENVFGNQLHNLHYSSPYFKPFDFFDVLQEKEDALLKKIDSFSKLEDNWDADGAVKIGKKAINNAKTIVQRLFEVDTNYKIYSSPWRLGGVFIDVKKNKNDRFQIYVMDNECKVFYSLSSATSITKIKIDNIDLIIKIFGVFINE